MEPVYFKTDNNNYYLYLPSAKYLLPIPYSLFEDLSRNGDSKHPLWISLKRNRLLNDFSEDFDGVVDSSAIYAGILNLSQIVFETTTSCNLRCEYCCYGDGYSTFEGRRLHNGNLKFETAKAIIDYLISTFKDEPETKSPTEPFAISFYGGEPLLNISVIKDIVSYALKNEFRNRVLSFTMTTNAMLLAKYADFLQEHKFKLLISLDGNKQHDAYRRTIDNKNSFDIVMSNLLIVRDKYPDWFNTFRFNTVYTDISNINEIIHWFKEVFNIVPNISLLHSPTKGAKGYSKIKSMMADLIIPYEMCSDEEILTQSPINKRVLELCNHLFFNNYLDEISPFEDKGIIPTGTCIPFSKRMFVSYDGKIHPCEKVNRDIPLGEISKDGLITIDCERIANDYMNVISSFKSACQQCYLQSCCTKCAYCFSDNKCEDFTNKERFTSLLSQSVSYVENHPQVVASLKDNIIFK